MAILGYSWMLCQTRLLQRKHKELSSDLPEDKGSNRAFFKGGDLNPGERHSCDTRDDGTVTLCALRAATVLSRNCCADFGRPLAKKVMSHSRDGPGVTEPSRTNIIPLTAVWSPLPSVTSP